MLIPVTDRKSVWEAVYKALPDMQGESHKGVAFSILLSNYGFHYRPEGISLSVGDYGSRTTYRRLKFPIKDKQQVLDTHALVAKFNELVPLAEQHVKELDERRKVLDATQEAYTTVCKETGYDDFESRRSMSDRLRIQPRTPDTVMIYTPNVTGAQLSAVSTIMGNPIMVRLQLDVPVDKAKAVYDILKGE